MKRRSAQTALFLILDTITKIMAPILAFTSDEIWQAMPHRSGDDGRNVVYNEMNKPFSEYELDADTMQTWDSAIALREDVLKALELARAGKLVGKSLDAKITLCVSENARNAYERVAGLDLPMLFIVSEVESVYGPARDGAVVFPGESFPGVTIVVEVSQQPKCVRCWTHSHTVGQNAEHPELCERCASALSV